MLTALFQKMSVHICVYLANQSKVRASEVWVEGRGYVGQRPLFMAGIYSRWKAAEQPPNHQSAEVYSYSIITR